MATQDELLNRYLSAVQTAEEGSEVYAMNRNVARCLHIEGSRESDDVNWFTAQKKMANFFLNHNHAFWSEQLENYLRNHLAGSAYHLHKACRRVIDAYHPPGFEDNAERNWTTCANATATAIARTSIEER